MSAGKPSGKTTRQLLFSKAISQSCTMASSHAPNGSGPNDASASTCPDITRERILQEITIVGCRLEVMDSKITGLAMESKSIRTNIAGFQDRVTEFDHRLTDVEGRLDAMPDRDQELQLLWNKHTDLENRSQRDNVHFFGIPERKEGTDVRAFLKRLPPGPHRPRHLPHFGIPTGPQVLSPPPNKDTPEKPYPIIACFLRQEQVQ
ncbi:hypothetical protein NDU88_004394 [Pleurodeles waltl]|uniref:Uncharacterized protein n=1 Tax=Pleurodeles waltl TaxID=8319 RepID=A0AAV7QHP3_PLEWA|nr:hypothetical protein NDU88_004394 [Pleurodeles waltl]